MSIVGKSDPFSNLPNELSLHVLSYFTKKELCTYSLVCKSWSVLTSDDIFWKDLLPKGIFPENELIKNYISKHIIFKKEDFDLRLTSFFDQVCPNKPAHFNCHFLFDPDCKIQIKINSKSDSDKNEMHVEQWFVRKIPNLDQTINEFKLSSKGKSEYQIRLPNKMGEQYPDLANTIRDLYNAKISALSRNEINN